MSNISSHLNCLQICLYNICKQNQLADYLMFTDAWRFSYDNKKPFSQSLSLPWENDHKYLQDLQGLILEIIAINEMNCLLMLDVLEREIGRTNILMYINSYECPWHRGYKKLNIPHYVQVINIDRKKEVIICDDPYLNLYKMELSFKQYCQGCKTIRLYRNRYAHKKIDIGNILNYIYDNVNIHQMTSEIISFSKKLLLVKTQDELFDYMDDVYLCSNVRNLKFIADSRYELSYLFDNLSVISEKKLKLYEIAKQFEVCGTLFEKVNHFYIKLYFRSSDLQIKLQSIHDKLTEISKIENNILNLLKQAVT